VSGHFHFFSHWRRHEYVGWPKGTDMGVGAGIVGRARRRGGLGTAQAGTTDDLMDTTKHPVSVTMAMQADSFFGFNPSIYGTYGLTDNIALAFSFTYWTQISGVGVHDNAPWLETDVGLNFTFLEKRLSITPMIGFVHGQSVIFPRRVLSQRWCGSVNERTTAFEGVVPNIIANYIRTIASKVSSIMGYYKAIRSEGGRRGRRGDRVQRTRRYELLGYASQTGGRGHVGLPALLGERRNVRVNSMWSVGAHYEHLLTTRDSSAPGSGSRLLSLARTLC
jgi:hypothetical protein